MKVDPEMVEQLAGINCTLDEMASVLGCHKRTLERRFAALIKRGRDRGISSLRRWQFEAARKGNPALLIWLGKQHLGQREHREDTPTDPNLIAQATRDMVVALFRVSPPPAAGS